MRGLASTSMSRLFRMFILFMSIFFALLFVYQHRKTSSVSWSLTTKDTMRKRVNTHPRKFVPFNPDKTMTKDKRKKLNRGQLKTSEIANMTDGFGISRLEELKREVDVARSEKKNIVERMAKNVRMREPIYGDSENEEMKEARKLQEIHDEENLYEDGVEDEGQFDGFGDYSESVTKDQPKKPIFIVILARMRTGSSLLGEIFNQNPSLFFMYEPLIPIYHLLQSGNVSTDNVSHVMQSVSTDLLHGYPRCEFQEKLTQSWLKWKGGVVRNSKLIDLCKKPPRPKSQYRNCTLVTLNDLRNACQKTVNRFCMKTIRADLDYFEPLVNAGVNVKIIHLVRDPRGTANSRRLYYNFSRPKLPPRNLSPGLPHPIFKGKLDALGLLGDYPDHVVHTIPRLCQWTRDSLLQVQQKNPAWLRNRYKLVRYEDLAMDPIGIAGKIYDFLGLGFPRAVKQWIAKNTRSNDNRSVKTFSTHKNSMETAARWRQSLRPLQVRQVERICSETMKLLGYKVVENIGDLANPNVTLMEPLPIPDTF